MGKISSKTSFDYQAYTVVPVIASFDDQGHIKPVYVRIHGETYKIDSYFVRYAFAGQIEFNCKIVDGNRLLPLSLTYYQKECMWVIQRPNAPLQVTGHL